MSFLGQGLLFVAPTFVNLKVLVIKCPGLCPLVCFQVFFFSFDQYCINRPCFGTSSVLTSSYFQNKSEKLISHNIAI